MRKVDLVFLKYCKDFLINTTESDWSYKYTYSRPDEILEVVRMENFITLKDFFKLELISPKDLEGLYIVNDEKIFFEYKVIQEDTDKFLFYSLTTEAYNRFEQNYK